MILSSDPRYVKFAARYAFDLTRFAIEVCSMQPTWQQVDLFTSLQSAGSRTSVASGHGTGKSRSIGVAAIWHLLCYKDSNTMLTGPKYDQIKNIAWKEMNAVVKGIRKGPHAWIADYIVLDDKRVYIRNAKSSWFIYAKTAPKGAPENLAGEHNDWMLVIADEASGIPDENFGVIGGIMTDARNRMMICSQPTRPVGFFYDTHHSLSRYEVDVDGKRGKWNALTFSSEESPRVSREFIEEKLIQYGGRDDPQYQIKVLGKFPDQSSDYLLSRKQLETCINAPLVIGDNEPWGWVLSVDVAAGEGRDFSVVTLARVIGQPADRFNPRRVDIMDIPIYSNTTDIPKLAGEIFQLASEIPFCTVAVDSHGMGIGVYQLLQQYGVQNLIKVQWGKPCWKKEMADAFTNLRSQCIVTTARAIKNGMLSYPQKNKKEFLDQGSRLPYSFDGIGRYKIASKDEMKDQGIKSPDLFDTICHLFMLGVYYVPNGSEQAEGGTDLITQAASAFDDLD